VLSRTIPSHLSLFWGWRKNNVAVKSKLGQKKQFEKSDFLGFKPKSLSILDLECSDVKNAKNTTNNKFKIFKMFLWTSCQLFFNFSQLITNFSDHWYNFFYSPFVSNVVGCCRTQIWKCTATLEFFCLWNRRYILQVKNDKNISKKSTNLFLYFPKIRTILL